MPATHNLQRIELLRECLKLENAELLENAMADPLSLEVHMGAITVQAIRRELDELEGGAVREIAGMSLPEGVGA